jgi:hypothetical protein
MGTFVAILLGTMAGGLLVKTGSKAVPPGSPAGLRAAGLLGRIAAHFIPALRPRPSPGLRSNWNPFSETGAT